MSDVPLRKKLAGSDSYGHEWAKDGAVVNVPYDTAMELLAIPDAGFSVADTPEDLAAQAAGDTSGPERESDPEVTEPDPAEPMDEIAPEPDAPATDAPAKKTTARRSTKA
jgi:hypothetical protein